MNFIRRRVLNISRTRESDSDDEEALADEIGFVSFRLGVDCRWSRAGMHFALASSYARSVLGLMQVMSAMLMKESGSWSVADPFFKHAGVVMDAHSTSAHVLHAAQLDQGGTASSARSCTRSFRAVICSSRWPSFAMMYIFLNQCVDVSLHIVLPLQHRMFHSNRTFHSTHTQWMSSCFAGSVDHVCRACKQQRLRGASCIWLTNGFCGAA